MIDNNTIDKQSERAHLFSFPYDSTDKYLWNKICSAHEK
jgi:hypothetical protein